MTESGFQYMVLTRTDTYGTPLTPLDLYEE